MSETIRKLSLLKQPNTKSVQKNSRNISLKSGKIYEFESIQQKHTVTTISSERKKFSPKQGIRMSLNNFFIPPSKKSKMTSVIRNTRDKVSSRVEASRNTSKESDNSPSFEELEEGVRNCLPSVHKKHEHSEAKKLAIINLNTEGPIPRPPPIPIPHTSSFLPKPSRSCSSEKTSPRLQRIILEQQKQIMTMQKQLVSIATELSMVRHHGSTSRQGKTQFSSLFDLSSKIFPPRQSFSTDKPRNSLDISYQSARSDITLPNLDRKSASRKYFNSSSESPFASTVSNSGQKNSQKAIKSQWKTSENPISDFTSSMFSVPNPHPLPNCFHPQRHLINLPDRLSSIKETNESLTVTPDQESEKNTKSRKICSP